MMVLERDWFHWGSMSELGIIVVDTGVMDGLRMDCRAMCTGMD
jgi:hypothetical protein